MSTHTTAVNANRKQQDEAVDMKLEVVVLPVSDASIVFGTGVTPATPGSVARGIEQSGEELPA